MRIYGTYITDFLKLSTCMVFELQFNLKDLVKGCNTIVTIRHNNYLRFDKTRSSK